MQNGNRPLSFYLHLLFAIFFYLAIYSPSSFRLPIFVESYSFNFRPNFNWRTSPKTSSISSKFSTFSFNIFKGKNEDTIVSEKQNLVDGSCTVYPSTVCYATKSVNTEVVEPKIWTLANYRRPVHWVFKIGSLRKNLNFYEEVLGMKVHRHEEFASGCEASCNGPYGGAWSKTMVGYGKEEEQYCLELTANYGIESYELGNDYRYIAIDKSAIISGKEALIVKEKGQEFLVSPDGYRYLLVDMKGKKNTYKNKSDVVEPFLFVSFHVKNLRRSIDFYTKVLGAKVYENVEGTLGTSNSVVVGFTDDGVKIEMVEIGTEIDHKEASGRFATETEDGAPTYMGEKVTSVLSTSNTEEKLNDEKHRERFGDAEILHGPIKLQPHNEEVVIIKDPDGYEHCFVDARGYTNCMNVAYQEGGTTVLWDYRDRLEKAATCGENAKLEVAKVVAGEYDKEYIRQKISTLLESSKTKCVIFSQTSCPFCVKAKEKLKELGATFDVVEIDTMPGTEGYAVRLELNEITGKSTVPAIFIDNKYIGGFTDGVERLEAEGILVDVLKATGAL